MTAALWIVLGVPAMLAVTFVAGRLLGARRGWVALLVSGAIGWTAAVLVAGELTNWEWATLDMVLVALALGVLFTMAAAVAIDLIWRRDTRLETVRTSWLTDKHVVAGRWAAYTFMFWMVIVGLANRAGVEQFIYFQF